MKTCSKCHTPKELNEFYDNHRNPDGKQYWCKICVSNYTKEWRKTNHSYYPGAERSRHQKNKKAMWDYLSEHPCVDCGEEDPIVLQFDHVKGKKLRSVKAMINYSWEMIKEEIAKCVVRCANCHTRKTAKQRGYWHSKPIKSIT